MAGSELLIVDSVPREREGMRQLFDKKGFVCTALESVEAAKDTLTEKFFPVALVDLDLGHPGAGVDLVRHIRRVSRPTSVVVLTRRPSFEGAVNALRAGAVDVVHKIPAEVDYLVDMVQRTSERYQATEGGDGLLREVHGVLDDSFKVMLEMSRKVYAHLSLAAAPLRPKVLVVDGEQDMLKELSQLIQGKVWEVAGEMNGGGALDRGMSNKFDIVAARHELMDLRGSMVVRSIQAQHAEVLGLVYSSADGGRIERVYQGRIEDTERPFTGAAQLVASIETLVEELGTRAQERRFIQAFSGDHRPFLKRYAELKLKIDRLISE